jgi:prolyl-tRNA synthetase
METRRQPEQPKTGAKTTDASLRCCCGNLLARLVAEGVEIKCRRCKRQVILPIDSRGHVRIAM